MGASVGSEAGPHDEVAGAAGSATVGVTGAETLLTEILGGLLPMRPDATKCLGPSLVALVSGTPIPTPAPTAGGVVITSSCIAGFPKSRAAPDTFMSPDMVACGAPAGPPGSPAAPEAAANAASLAGMGCIAVLADSSFNPTFACPRPSAPVLAPASLRLESGDEGFAAATKKNCLVGDQGDAVRTGETCVAVLDPSGPEASLVSIGLRGSPLCVADEQPTPCALATEFDGLSGTVALKDSLRVLMSLNRSALLGSDDRGVTAAVIQYEPGLNGVAQSSV